MKLPELFHVSGCRFDRPSREAGLNFLLEHGDRLNKTPNGALGFWVSPFPESCTGVHRGDVDHFAKLSLKPDSRLAVMELNQLYGMYKALDDNETGHFLPYRDQVLANVALRDHLLKHTDVLFILDGYCSVGEVVILDYDMIDQFAWLDGFKPQGGVEFSEITMEIRDNEASRAIARLRFDPQGNVIEVEPRRQRLSWF